MGQENCERKINKTINNRKKTSVNRNVIVMDNLKCFYTNADQLKNKMTEFQIRVGEWMPHIIGITEVKPKSSLCVMNSAEFILEEVGEYDIHSKNIGETQGR
jgi:hypothetical protein